MGIYCTIFQYPDGCNADQGSLILATSHTHKQKNDCEHDLSPPITLTRPWSFIQLLRWKPILPSALQQVQWNSWIADNDSMKFPSSKPHTVVPWWPFCTGKQQAHAKCTALPFKYNTTHIQTPEMLPKFHLSGEAHWLDHSDHPNVWALSLSDQLLRSYWP